MFLPINTNIKLKELVLYIAAYKLFFQEITILIILFRRQPPYKARKHETLNIVPEMFLTRSTEGGLVYSDRLAGTAETKIFPKKFLDNLNI